MRPNFSSRVKMRVFLLAKGLESHAEYSSESL